MMSRLIRSSVIAAFALALSAGTAAAQDPCGGEEEWSEEGGDACGGGDVCGGDVCGGDTGDTGDAGGDDSAEPAPPGEAAAGPAAGAIKAGATILIPQGLNDEGDFAIGAYIELRPWASYQVNEKIKAHVVLPLLVVTPDLGDDLTPDLLQGVIAGASYAVNDKLNAGVMAGMARPWRMFFNPYGNPVLPGTPGDLKAGFGAGADYSHKMDKIHVNAGVKLVAQLDSNQDADGMGMGLQVPLAAMYAVNEKLSAGVATGIYSGPEFEFDADKGMTVPFIVGAKYAVNEQISAGGFAGLSSIVAPEMMPEMGVGDMLTLGVFAAWSK